MHAFDLAEYRQTRISRVFEKLDVNSRAQAVERARAVDILP